MWIWMWLGCAKVEPVDTGDTAVEEYPCAAPYFPVSLGSRSFQLNTYRGRFEQGLTEEVVEQSFVGLAELSSSDLEACVYSGISPFGAGSDYTLFGVGEEWLYLLADGDDSSKAEPDYKGEPPFYHQYREPIPLLPFAPESGTDFNHEATYEWLGHERPATIHTEILNTAATITVGDESYEVLHVSWEWDIINEVERPMIQLDITGYYSVEEGLLRLSWYDELEQTSGLVEWIPN